MMSTPIDQLTAQGYDMQFGSNVLGHFYLTYLLLPLLTKSAKDSPDKKSRVVNVSSTAHMFAYLDFETLRDGKARRKRGSAKIWNEQFYFQSKLVSYFPIWRATIPERTSPRPVG